MNHRQARKLERCLAGGVMGSPLRSLSCWGLRSGEVSDDIRLFTVAVDLSTLRHRASQEFERRSAAMR